MQDRAWHFCGTLLQISDSWAVEGLRVGFSVCLPRAFRHRRSPCLVAHVNLSVVLHRLDQDNNFPLSFLFPRIQKVPSGLNRPSKILTQAPVSYSSFSAFGSLTILPLEDPAVQLLQEECPQMKYMSRILEWQCCPRLRKLRSSVPGEVCISVQECKYYIRVLCLTSVISAERRRGRLS